MLFFFFLLETKKKSEITIEIILVKDQNCKGNNDCVCSASKKKQDFFSKVRNVKVIANEKKIQEDIERGKRNARNQKKNDNIFSISSF